ncbi:MAG: DUF4426 domain-containing protein [bacterium]
MLKTISAVITSISLMVLSQSLFAENSTKVGGYTIHHNALTTDILTPEVANTYHIRRSSNRGMLNVSVVKDEANTTGKPVRAWVSVKAQNLRGQVRYIPMREIREGDAIYYIGHFLVEHRENINFEIKVTPDRERTPYIVTMNHQFFTK